MSQNLPPTTPPNVPPMNYAAGYMPQQRRTSVAAIISLVCGIVGCFIVTGIVAIITGIIGLRATRNPNVAGRGLAIAGLILGVIGVVGGGGCLVAGGAGLFVANKESNKGAIAIDGLLNAIANGDNDAAMTFVDPKFISREAMDDIVEKVKPLGKPGPFEKSGFNDNRNYGTARTIDLPGSVVYPGLTQSWSFVVQQQPDASYKVIGLEQK